MVHTSAKIITKNMVADDICRIELQLASSITVIAGQYILLSFEENDKNEDLGKHAFSIVSYDEKTQVVCVIIKLHGAFTRKLFDCVVGDSLVVDGPYGRFTLLPTVSKYIFIAGGIGITPLYAMAKFISDSKNSTSQTAQALDKNLSVDLYYSAKSKQIVLAEELDCLNKSKTSADATRAVTVTINKTDVQGRLSPKSIIENTPDISERAIYICGPAVMIEEFRSAFLANGISDDLIRSEDFS